MVEFVCEDTNESATWDTWDVIQWQLPSWAGGGNQVLFAFKDAWVINNKRTIKAWAEAARFPALLLGGVCWAEVGGDPEFIDGAAHAVRSFDWSGPDWIDENMTITRRPELTSFGPVSMQLRRAAETLGHNIEDLSFMERRALGACLEVDVFNIRLTALHLRELIDLDGLQTNPPDLSDDGIKVAGARYNRGPDLTLAQIRTNLSYGESIIRRRERIAGLLA